MGETDRTMRAPAPPVFAPEKSSGGDSNRITRDYLDALLIEYRHIGACKPDLTFELFGRRFRTPIMLGGMAAMVPGLHESGMRGLAEGAKRAGAVFWSGYVGDAQFADALTSGRAARVRGACTEKCRRAGFVRQRHEAAVHCEGRPERP